MKLLLKDPKHLNKTYFLLQQQKIVRKKRKLSVFKCTFRWRFRYVDVSNFES